MFERLLSWRLRRWRNAWRPDAEAEAEGLAAGTGLLTGEVARGSRPDADGRLCPACDGVCEVVVVDLMAGSTTRKCRSCARRWTTEDLKMTPGAPAAGDRRPQ